MITKVMRPSRFGHSVHLALATVLALTTTRVDAAEPRSSAVTPGLASPAPRREPEPARPTRRKFRATGELIALVPGFLIHGLGQFYAGRKDRALVLAGTEEAAIVLGAQTGSGQTPPTRKENALGVASAVLFAGGWLYDVITTPGAVEDWNVAHGFGTERRSVLGVGVDAVRSVIGLPGVAGAPLAPAPASATGLVVAVATFAAEGVAAGEAAVAADWVRSELIRSARFRVVERAQMDAVLAEQAFQQTGCTTDDCAVRLGKLLNAERIVVGRLASFLGEYVLTVSVVSAETGQVVATDAARGRNAEEVIEALKAMAGRLAAAIR